MSHILLVEPDKMLRQAFALALFPEYQIVRAVDAIPATVSSDCDLMIVDGATLRASAALTDQGLRAAASSGLPLIWIDDRSIAPVLKRNRVVRLSPPVVQGALREALAQCLESAVGLSRGTISAEILATEARARAQAPTGKKVVAPKHENFIELVDVVETDLLQASTKSSR